jgi:hypothetical protein
MSEVVDAAEPSYVIRVQLDVLLQQCCKAQDCGRREESLYRLIGAIGSMKRIAV